MGARNKAEWPKHLRQIQLITADSSEGVIMIDVTQTIKWANAAALSMHGVHAVADLGRTIDEYHANFQIKFRGAVPVASDQAVDSIAAGESFRDVVIEVTPLQGSTPQWAYRVRNLVLVDEGNSPTCIVLVLRPLQGGTRQADWFSASLGGIRQAAIIMRREDGAVLRANDEFFGVTGREVICLTETPLTGAEIFGEGHEALAGAKATSLLSPTRPGAPPIAVIAMPIDYAGQACTLFHFVEAGPLADGGDATPSLTNRALAETAALCAAAPSPLIAIGPAMEIAAVSQAFLDMLGRRRDELLGRAVTEFLAQSSASYVASHTWPNLSHEPDLRDLSCDFVKAGGGIVHTLVSACATLDRHGNPEMVLAAIVDVTQRRRSEESFATLFALSPVPMLIRKLDDQRILDANDAFLAATGFSPPSVVGHCIDELGLCENRAVRQQFDAAIRTESGLHNQDARLKTASGDMLDCLLSARRVHAFGQSCVLMVLQDVSERRRNETQLYQAIQTVMQDTSWFSRSVIEKLATLRSPPKHGGRAAEIGELTPRERQVLGLISHGLADADIAQKLGLTRSTVRNHVATLYSKIGVHSRSSAIIWARERGINIAWPSAQAASLMRTGMAQAPSGVAIAGKTRRA